MSEAPKTEALSYNDIKRRVEGLPAELSPVGKYVLMLMYVCLDSIVSTRETIRLLQDEPQEAVRRYRKLWKPAGIPEDVLSLCEPTPKDIPKHQAELRTLEQQEMELVSALSALERGRAKPMLDLLSKERGSTEHFNQINGALGIDMHLSLEKEKSPVMALIDAGIESLRRHFSL